jgi:diacylglycerol O-acyltransferase
MAHVDDNDRLSWGDSLFVYLERDGAPLNVAAVTVFEGDIAADKCGRFIETKLPLIPRYRQRVVTPPLNMGLPVWDWDPKFDVRNHVREVFLKEGTAEELKATASTVLSQNMDVEHPRWDFTLLRGLKPNCTGVIVRIHHCLADGIAGMGLMNVLMDASPVAKPLPRKRVRFEAPPPRDPAALMIDGLITSSFSVIQRLLSMQKDVLGLVEKVLAYGGWPVEEFLKLLPDLAAPIERMPFNRLCYGPQGFGWTEVPLADIKAVRHAFEVTINDVVLAVFTLAFRRYAKLHNVQLDGRLLRIVVPVNVRNGNNQNDLGNRISFIPVSVPLDEDDPRKVIANVHRCMEFLKNSHAAEMVGLFGSMLSLMPVPMQSVAWPLLSKAPISLCNVICTNVPGPQEPLYLQGHKMLSCYPYVPIGGEMGINCAVLTYNGTAFIGLTSDVHAVPDLPILERFLSQSFVELAKAAGLKPARPKREAPKRKAKSKVAAATSSAEKRTKPAVRRRRTQPPSAKPPSAPPATVVTSPAAPVNEEPAQEEVSVAAIA